MFDKAQKYWKLPFRYDAEGQFILDADGNIFLNVRGWGFLTGKGSHGLPEDKAIEIQDETGEQIAKLINENWNK